MILMCVACVDLGWVAMGRILKDRGLTVPPPPSSKSICYFVFAIFFILFLCPNTEQPKLSIGHLQNENDHNVSYISIYLIAIQSFISNNVLLTHLS
jgi:hypothetical protein